MPTDRISLIPPGKLRCVITGELRSETPEEHVRQRIARSLLDDYGYRREDFEVEFPLTMGRTKKRADLAIFPPESSHDQEHVQILVECKRDDTKPSDSENGVDQLKSYMAASMNCRWGIWIGSELQVWESVQTTAGTRQLEIAADIPRFGSDAPKPLNFTQLVPAEDELIGVFRRCHNYIHGNQGLPKERGFQELLKIIFCKVLDEDTSAGEMRFFIGNEERRSELGQRRLRHTIEDLFGEVKDRYPYIFETEEKIRLNNQVLAYVVGEMQRFSLLQTRADVKGAAYEQLVGANLRGERGEFFTPRNVCDMAVRMVFARHPPSRWTSLKVLDPACGTGGFLVSVLGIWREAIFSQQSTKWSGEESRALEETSRVLRDTANRQLFGIDFNPTLARAAQMNLVMHGDGSSNVYHANSLLPPGEWPSEPPNDVAHQVHFGGFDVVVTNPPFGSKIPIDDPHILEQFELATLSVEEGRKVSMPPEQLFIERSWQFLKAGGIMAIVLPDSILSNPGLEFIRRWILQKMRVVASVDLPQVTFEPYTGTQTSVLFLEKKSREEIKMERDIGSPRDYPVFMAVPEAVGHDRRGEPVYLRTPEGEVVEHEETVPAFRRDSEGEIIRESRTFRRKVVHDELPLVARQFDEWLETVADREDSRVSR